MKNYSKTITCLKLLFITVIIISTVYFNIKKPGVMILQSYDTDYVWTRDIDSGLDRIMNKWSGYLITRHYMSTKKHSDPKWLKRAGIIAVRAIKRAKPKVLIAIDDHAQSLAAKFFIDDPDMEIVFAGVNGSIEPYGYHKANNVTGIYERKQLRAVRETIVALERLKENPSENPKLLYILDSSSSLKKGRSFVDDFKWEPVEYSGSIIAENYEHWKKIVIEKGKTVDYIIVANYRKLPVSKTDKNYKNSKEVMTWTEENSKVPVIGINAFNVADGAMISIGVSPFEQGEVAAKMAEKILTTGVSAKEIPIQSSSQYIIALNEEAMEKRQIRLPAIYEAFSRATENYIEK